MLVLMRWYNRRTAFKTILHYVDMSKEGGRATNSNMRQALLRNHQLLRMNYRFTLYCFCIYSNLSAYEWNFQSRFISCHSRFEWIFTLHKQRVKSKKSCFYSLPLYDVTLSILRDSTVLWKPPPRKLCAHYRKIHFTITFLVDIPLMWFWPICSAVFDLQLTDVVKVKYVEHRPM